MENKKTGTTKKREKRGSLTKPETSKEETTRDIILGGEVRRGQADLTQKWPLTSELKGEQVERTLKSKCHVKALWIQNCLPRTIVLKERGQSIAKQQDQSGAQADGEMEPVGKKASSTGGPVLELRKNILLSRTRNDRKVGNQQRQREKPKQCPKTVSIRSCKLEMKRIGEQGLPERSRRRPTRR